MQIISLCDNRFGQNGYPLPETLSEEQRSLLRKFSGKTLKKLKEECVVVFPDSGSKSDDLPFFTIVEDKRIDTGNLMGVLRLRGYGAELKIQIGSRFDQDGKQFFLNYLLSKVFGLNFAGSVSSGRNPEKVLDILLAHGFLQRFSEAAARVGAYKQYRKFYCNDLNFRGRLDLDRHIKQNCPLWDKIAYIKREHTFDNPLNHLFLSAFQKIEENWHELAGRDHDCREIICFLKQHAPTWAPSDVHGILSHRDCREALKHPLFGEFYEDLRKLARLILEDESANVFEDEKELNVAGVIFDGAWLWEEYVATLLGPKGFIHAQRSSQEAGTEGIHVFQNDQGSREKLFYPDFRKPIRGEDKRECSIILDTKYKRGDTDNRSDIHQVLCYMYLTGAKTGGLIYPPKIDKEDVVLGEEGDTSKSKESGVASAPASTAPEILITSKKINTPLGKDYNWLVLRFPPLGKYAHMSEFCERMKSIEEDFLKRLEHPEKLLRRSGAN